jgi:hypothetical protein
LSAAAENVPLTCRVELPDGEVKHIRITPQLTTADLVKLVMKLEDVAIREPYNTGWGIWETSEHGSIPLCSDAKLCDVMVAWDNNSSYALLSR